MTRLAAAFWIMLVSASGFSMFLVKYAVQGIEDRLDHVRKQTIVEQQEIRVLNAEWTYLNQPERLADLNRRFLGLQPIVAKQLEGRVDQIAFRALPTPPTMVASAPAPIPAPAAPLVVAAAAATRPHATPIAAVRPTDAAPPRSLGALIAQIDPAAMGSPSAAEPQPRTAAEPAKGPAPLDTLMALITPTAAEAKPIAGGGAMPSAKLAQNPPGSLDALIARIAEKP